MKLNETIALHAAADAYIKEHPQIHLQSMLKTLREQGHTVSDQTIRRLLTERGMTVKGFGDKWLWGYWDGEKEVKPFRPHPGEKPFTAPSKGLVTEATASNTALTNELSALQAAVQRSVELKREIKNAQERLLVELADLIKATYGQVETESPVEAFLRPSTASKRVHATVPKAEQNNASKGNIDPSTAMVEPVVVTTPREPETEAD